MIEEAAWNFVLGAIRYIYMNVAPLAIPRRVPQFFPTPCEMIIVSGITIKIVRVAILELLHHKVKHHTLEQAQASSRCCGCESGLRRNYIEGDVADRMHCT